MLDGIPSKRQIGKRLRAPKQPTGRACPSCGGHKVVVADSRPRPTDNVIRRRLHCIDCKYRFTSIERLDRAREASELTLGQLRELWISLRPDMRRTAATILRAMQSVGNDDEDEAADTGPTATD